MAAADKLRDALVYLLCAAREHNRPVVANSRLTKMVYLADWRMALSADRQITEIRWRYHHFGPFVPDVRARANQSNSLDVNGDTDLFGSPTWIRLAETARMDWPSLDDDEVEALQTVIDATIDLSYEEFLAAVYETYPIRVSRKYSELDLVTLARERRERYGVAPPTLTPDGSQLRL